MDARKAPMSSWPMPKECTVCRNAGSTGSSAFAPASPASTLVARASSARDRSAVMVKESTISSA
jgi:hypothetical protein